LEDIPTTKIGRKIPFLLNDKKNKREKTMKEVISLVKGWVDDIAHLLMSFVAI